MTFKGVLANIYNNKKKMHGGEFLPKKYFIFAMIFIIFVKIVKCAMSLFYWIFKIIILFL